MDINYFLQKQQIIFILLTCLSSLLHYCNCYDNFDYDRDYEVSRIEYEIARLSDPRPVVFPEYDREDNDNHDSVEDDDNSYYSKQYGKNNDNNNRRSERTRDTLSYPEVTAKISQLLAADKYNKEKNRIAKLYGDNSKESKQNDINPFEYSDEEIDDNDFDEYPPKKKNYAFAYKVLDKDTGDDFSHQQIRNAKATNGEYRVKLPDGRLQIVSYKADKDGYKADVTYEKKPTAAQHKPKSHKSIENSPRNYLPKQIEIQQVRVKELPETEADESHEDYDEDDEGGGEEYGEQSEKTEEQQLLSPLKDPRATNDVVVLEQQSGPTRIPVNYVDVVSSPAPSPLAAYFTAATARGPAVNHGIRPHANVQIHIPEEEDIRNGNYQPKQSILLGLYNNFIRYTSTPVAPTVQQLQQVQPLHAPTTIHQIQPSVSAASQSYPVGDAFHKVLAQENELPEGIYIIGKARKK